MTEARGAGAAARGGGGAAAVLCVSVAVLAASGCGAARTTPRTAGDPSVEAAARIMDGAEREVARGERLAAEGDWTEARAAFDRAVDELLDLPGGIAANPGLRDEYRRIVERIHTLERAAAEAATRAGATPSEALVATMDLPEPQDELPTAVDGEPAARGGELPVVVNERVASIVRLFCTDKRTWFEQALERSRAYLADLRSIFREEGVPEDLVYVAMIESAFRPRAVSWAGAAGMWQFMAGTARLYGLRRDEWVDERFDPYKAARAAARHLRDLYAEFGDWYLALAAYNAGAGRVREAVARTGSRDFWTLARTRALRRETRSYVPLFLAALVLAKTPARCGLAPPPPAAPAVELVELDAPVDLATAARAAGTSVETLRELNPELRRWVTPPDRDTYALRVPAGRARSLEAALAAIPPAERVRFRTHTVRRGDTLSGIARRYGVTADAVARANRIRLTSIIHPGQVLTVPVPVGVPLGPSERAASPSPETLEGEVYVVRRGDTLSAIAARHGVRIADLRRWNRLGRRSLIRPGDRLVVRPSDKPGSDAGPVIYRVRRGDTLSHIARRFRVSVDEIRRWNRLAHDRIYAGDALEIYPATR